MRREGRRKRFAISSRGGILLQDDFCEILCQATDISTVSKRCADLSNEECATAAFYESDAKGDRRLCALKAGAGISLSDPKAKDCEVDWKRKCSKDQRLCTQEVPATNDTVCQFCGSNDFLPEATAYMEDGKPFTCAHALELIHAGQAPMSCAEAAQQLPDCCRQATHLRPVPPGTPCELCAHGGLLRGSAVAMVLQGDPMSCAEAQLRLSENAAPVSCETAQSSELAGRCCYALENCSICDNFQPNATVDLGNIRVSCSEAVESSSSCDEAKSSWSDSCCRGTTSIATIKVDTEEATPFCKSLCLKSDVSEWNMTCQELPQEECETMHFFQTLSACERRLCVWSSTSCSLDYTQTCMICNWPCGRKVTTVTTTEGPRTSTTTTSATTTGNGATVAVPNNSSVSGVEVPAGCFDFCAHTDVRSMSFSCSELPEGLCSSGKYYQTDAQGNRRHCRYEVDECLVDESFVCNASMPICSVSEEVEPEATEAPEKSEVSEETRLASLKSLDAAARECLAAGSSERAIWRIFRNSTEQTGLSSAERAFKRALDVALILQISLENMESTLKEAFAAGTSSARNISTTDSPTRRGSRTNRTGGERGSLQPVRSTTPTTTEAETPLFGCSKEICPEVSTALCDSAEWKQTQKCICQCKRYRPHVAMVLVDNLGFNDFVDSSDMAPAWPFLRSILPKSILINSSYAEVGSAPSRAAFLTGRQQHHMHFAQTPVLTAEVVDGPEGWQPLGISRHRQVGSTAGAFAQDGEMTLPQKLATTGYKSYAVGKWQSGSVSWKMTPSGRGFSRFFGHYAEGADYVQHCDMNGHYDLHYEESEPFEAKNWSFTRPYHYYPAQDMVGKHSNTIFTEKAEQFIRDHQERHGKDTPMFLYYAPMSFQEPLQAPMWTAPNCTGVASFSNANRQTLCRMAVSLDRSLERIAQAMAGAFRNDNWVMIVASDGGGSAAHRSAAGSNWPLRGSKGEVWEGGIRTKALVTGNHPELDRAAMLGHMYSGGYMHLVDWHATILHLAQTGPSFPGDEGVAMWQALLNGTASPSGDFIANVSHAVAIRSGRYKLVMAPWGGKNPNTGEIEGIRWPVRNMENDAYLSRVGASLSTWSASSRWQLFDIWSDPIEDMDLALQKPQEVERLLSVYQKLSKGRQSNGDSMLACSVCDDVPRKAIAVMRKHAAEVQTNPCPIQEPSYPYWDEAVALAQRPFSK